MEMVINHNCIANKVQLPLYVQFRDALAYGIGPVSPGWTVRRGSRIRKAEGGILGLFKSLGNRKAIEEDVILYEGNDLTNIDPYRYLPDPNVSAHKVQEGEFDSMVNAIQSNWELSDVEAALVAESAVSAITKGLDYYRMSRQFFESTTEDERVHFMDALFAVADGDEGVSYEEIEEIRTIAIVLKLHHSQFIDAKLKIPRERRAN